MDPDEEYDTECTSCGGRLTYRDVGGDTFARCVDCGRTESI